MEQRLILAPASPQGLSQAQSLALVQMFLNASLACISHARELIPWTSACFRTCFIDSLDFTNPTSRNSSYADFQALGREATNVGKGQEIKMLVRGCHRCADQMLDMLENGVFEAIDRGYLASLAVFVTKSSRRSQCIIEAYTFTFAYDHGRVRAVQLSPANLEFTPQHAQKSFKVAIRALLRALKDMPRPPGRRSLGMTLSYRRSCPMIYQPPGFIDRDVFQEKDGQLTIEGLENLAPDVVGRLETGHHQVSVGVHLQPFDSTDASWDAHDTAMSKQLQAMQKTSSIQSNNLLPTLKESVSGPKRPADSEPPTSKRAKVNHVRNLRSSDRAQSTDNGIVPASSQHSENLSLAGGESPSLAKSLRSSVFPQQESQQSGFFCLEMKKLVELLVHCYAIQTGLAGDGGHTFDPSLLADGIIKRCNRSSQIRCECGLGQSTNNMLYCEICDTWQHAKCYGYGEVSISTTIPQERFCYTCLMTAETRHPGGSSACVVHMRNSVCHLTEETNSGLVLDGDFLASRLKHCRWTEEIVGQVMNRLIQEHLLLVVGKDKFKVQKLNQADLREVQRRFVHPLAMIDGLYNTCTPGEAHRKRGDEITSLLVECARGQDYVRAEGCERLTSHDEFGESIVRWGYKTITEESAPPSMPASSLVSTPLRPRRMSISGVLINIDYSPSATSMSFAGSPSQPHDDAEYNTDFSTLTSLTSAV